VLLNVTEKIFVNVAKKRCEKCCEKTLKNVKERYF